MDYTRHAPGKGSSYEYLLTPSENATVTIGNSRPISLQDAIKQKKVSIEGTNLTIDQLRDTDVWRRLTPEQKREFERDFASIIAEAGGDYMHLVFVNKTSRPMTINLGSSVIVGAEDEPAPLIATEVVGASGGSSQADVQAQFWRAATKKHQAMLQDASYYKGSLSGEVDEATKRAISKFKADHGLTADSVIDSQTESALIRASTVSRNGKYLALTLETGGGGSLYRLYAPGGEPLYSGNQIEGLITAINTERGRKGRGNNVYLIMKGFSANQVQAFITSGRNYQNTVDPAVSIRPFESSGDSAKAEDFFFSPGKRLVEDSITEPVLVTDGPNSNFYLSRFSVEDAAGDSGTVSVFARAREVVVSFVRGVRTMFQVRRESWSVSKIVNVARSQMRKKYDVSDDDLRIEFKDQFGGSHVVKLIIIPVGVSATAE